MEKLSLSIPFLEHDARNIPFDHEFDVAIMLCEKAFPLMKTDEMNYETLKNVTRSLTATGLFIFTTLNRLFPLYHSVEKFSAKTTGTGNATYQSNTFDLMTFCDHNQTVFEDDNGIKKTLTCDQRYDVPSEIT